MRSRRITTSSEWIPEVDGVRFVAIMLVLIQHIHERVLRRTSEIYRNVSGSAFDTLLGTGSSGVLIFFTLSGYILGKILISKYTAQIPVSLKGFYLRRLTRLEPPYLLIMTGIFVMLSASGYKSSFTRSFEQGASSLLDGWLASISYSYCIIYGTMPKLNPPAWSLEVEIQFYFFAPLLAWILTRFPRGRLRLLVLAASILGLANTLSITASKNAHLNYTLLKFAPYFLSGFAVLELQATRFAKGYGLVWDALAALSLGGLLFEGLWISPALHIPFSVVAAFLVVAGCLNGNLLRRFLSIPCIALTGGMCYSIYLIHLPLLELSANHTVRLGRGIQYPMFLALQLLLLLPIVFGASWVLFTLVERPCMDSNWPARLRQWFLKLFSTSVSPADSRHS